MAYKETGGLLVVANTEAQISVLNHLLQQARFDKYQVVDPNGLGASLAGPWQLLGLQRGELGIDQIRVSAMAQGFPKPAIMVFESPEDLMGQLTRIRTTS